MKEFLIFGEDDNAFKGNGAFTIENYLHREKCHVIQDRVAFNGCQSEHPRVIATKGGITMLQPSSFALFLFLGAYLLYDPGMKAETVGILGFCVGAGLISMGLALFGHHPWVKKWLNRLF